MRKVNKLIKDNYYIIWNPHINECLFVTLHSDNTAYEVVGGIVKSTTAFLDAELVYIGGCDEDENDVVYKLTKAEVLNYIVIGNL